MACLLSHESGGTFLLTYEIMPELVGVRRIHFRLASGRHAFVENRELSLDFEELFASFKVLADRKTKSRTLGSDCRNDGFNQKASTDLQRNADDHHHSVQLVNGDRRSAKQKLS